MGLTRFQLSCDLFPGCFTIGRLHYDVKRAKIPGSCSKVRAKQRRTNNADCVLFCLRLAELL